MTGLGEYVKRLCLHICVLQGLPLQVLLGEFGERRVTGILAYGLDGVRTVLRLLGAGNGS